MGRGFYEFFAGAGMARAGLGSGWTCLFANDIDQKKCTSYQTNWRDGVIKSSDVKLLKTEDLPGIPKLIWASFPCQDLSLAGAGAGLKGDRSGTFWPFWRLISKLIDEGRPPSIVALENVPATFTSHGGKDFEALCAALVDQGYNIGARVVDAALFVPQSRPRMFLIAVHANIEIPPELVEPSGSLAGIDRHVAAAVERLKERVPEVPALQRVVDGWINWALPQPTIQPKTLYDLIEHEPSGVEWHSAEETQILLDRMSELNKRKLAQAREAKRKVLGTAYRRTRVDGGVKSVRTEVRFDGISGCLRTPAGGSSRQIVIEVHGDRTRSRLMTVREAARLMGLPDHYVLPEAYNEGYHLVGDGVAVGVVRYLADSIFEPIIDAEADSLKKAA